jgi:hypothetical protein
MNRISILLCILGFAAILGKAQAPVSSGMAHTGPTNQTVNIEGLVDRYFDSLNELDDKQRRELTKLVWVEQGKFGTPFGEVEGREAIEALVGGVHKRFPNSTVRRTSKIDGFSNYFRWSFTLFAADGTPILSGVDFAIIDNEKLLLVMGFFDFAPNHINARGRELER